MQSRCRPGSWSRLRAQSASKLSGLLATFVFSGPLDQEKNRLDSQWAAGRRLPLDLPDVTICPSKHANWEGQERGYVSNVDATLKCDVITGPTSHHFGHTLLARSKSQVTPTFKGISWVPRARAQILGVRIILESAHPRGNLENNKQKQEGVRPRCGMGPPGDGMSKTVSVVALEAHPGKPLRPRETRAVGHPAWQDTDGFRWCHMT